MDLGPKQSLRVTGSWSVRELAQLGILAFMGVTTAWKLPGDVGAVQAAQDTKVTADKSVDKLKELEIRIFELAQSTERTGRTVSALSSRVDQVLILTAANAGPELSLPAARRAAEKTRRKIAQGVDPTQDLAELQEP